MRSFGLTSAALAIALALPACSSGGGGGTGPNNSATQMAAQSGNNQVAPAGAALAPLEVVVRDANNAPVAGVPVTWAVGSGGGAVSATSTTTGANGIASVVRTLGPGAGTQTTTATRTGLTGSPVTFSATATIQGATQMALSGGSGQTDSVLSTLATPYAVVVRDHTGAAVAGVTVTWSATGGSIAPSTSTTNASGIATATRTLGGTAGAQTASAAVAGLIGSPVGFTATATAGNPVLLLKTSGDAGIGAVNSAVNYTVTVQDAHGNPRQGVTVNWEVLSGGGSVSPASTATGTNGQAGATRTLSGTAGLHETYAIAATVPAPDTVTFATTATTAPTTANVSVGNNFFNPTSVSVAAGGTVTWNWNSSGVVHNVTFLTAGAPANIGNRNSGSDSRVFSSAGTFNYECTIHSGMTGSVMVQ